MIAAQVEIHSSDDLSGLKDYYSPLESRRMGRIMKAALLASLRSLDAAGIKTPDAIITATSRGMLETSQQFMNDIDANGEDLLKPTLFMQSTHNTVGSAIAIKTGCHGYNITYSQGDDSEKWALRDAERLLGRGDIDSVLVCSFDESTPLFDSFTSRSGEKVPEALTVKSLVLKRSN